VKCRPTCRRHCPKPRSSPACGGGDSGRLSAAAAPVILKIGFHDEDVTRIRDLARKNSEGSISAGELTEYDNYVKVADLLAILQSKARQVLKRKPVTRARRG
jgi:hypothetical protein